VTHKALCTGRGETSIPSMTYFMFDDACRGVTRLDGARGKKQFWRPHVRKFEVFRKQMHCIEESTKIKPKINHFGTPQISTSKKILG